MKRLPQVSVPLLADELNMSAPTTRTALNRMVKLSMLEEVSGKKGDKVYCQYLAILEKEAEPFLASR